MIKKFALLLVISLFGHFSIAQSIETIKKRKTIKTVMSAERQTLEKYKCYNNDKVPHPLRIEGDVIICDCDNGTMDFDQAEEKNLISEAFKKHISDYASKNTVTTYEFFKYDNKIYLHCFIQDDGKEREMLFVESK